jgi:hypothetical protein
VSPRDLSGDLRRAAPAVLRCPADSRALAASQQQRRKVSLNHETLVPQMEGIVIWWPRLAPGDPDLLAFQSWSIAFGEGEGARDRSGELDPELKLSLLEGRRRRLRGERPIPTDRVTIALDFFCSQEDLLLKRISRGKKTLYFTFKRPRIPWDGNRREIDRFRLGMQNLFNYCGALSPLPNVKLLKSLWRNSRYQIACLSRDIRSTNELQSSLCIQFRLQDCGVEIGLHLQLLGTGCHQN